MSLIFLFRRLVFAQVLLGILSFCMAEQNPGMLLVAGALGAMSWYVTEGPTGRPLPKWVINLGSLAAVAWLIVDLFWQRGDVILAMGHFTMWLQILLLYANKSNRDYGQLLVLSLLQMVGASVLSVSIVYGVLLLAYCVLTLFTVLVFHLKTTSDMVLDQNQAAAPLGTRVPRSKVVNSRGHRWQFRLTAASVGAVCGGVAVLVFVLFPRTSSREGRMITPISSKQVGFSDEVRLDSGAPIGGSREPILSLAIATRDRNIGSEGTSWLLRGAALDTYNPLQKTWTRGTAGLGADLQFDLGAEGVALALVPDSIATFDAKITIRNPGDRTLFTLHPVTFVSSPSLDKVEFNPQDQQLASAGAPAPGAIVYYTKTPITPPPGLFDQYLREGVGRRPILLRGSDQPSAHYARGWEFPTKPLIQKMTLDVLRAAGLDRDPTANSDPRDPQIARALAEYLQTNFKYALVNPPPGRNDPIVDFLYHQREGHCELFASALAAMARSVGMAARVVTGYRASEYNRFGGYYVVRQSNAHAWTEIWCGEQGWRTFDATPPVAVAAEHKVERGLFTAIRELYEHLEFAWISSVIAYDKETRQAVLHEINRSVREATVSGDNWLTRSVAWVHEQVRDWQFDGVTYAVIAFICFFIVVGVVSLVRTLVLRRQRFVALQLMKLPRPQRRSLARRLRFYLEMLDMLERHGYRRPAWQSPAGFAQQLAASDPMRFDPVVALTEHFYEIRFGYRDLDSARQRLIRAHLQRLQQSLITSS